MAKKVGVIGTGEVGETLANGFLKHGYEVMRGSRDPAKLKEWTAEAGPKGSAGTMADAAKYGDIVVVSVKGAAAESAIQLAGPEALAGKVVIDTTNPINEVPPTDGVLHFFTGLEDSLLERLQRLAPKARFVKCFSCVGADLMVDPDLGTPPTMFICGNDAAAKTEVQGILKEFGWEWEDLGKATAARAIEPLAILWCIPGFLRNQWTHALKLLKK